VSLIFGAVVNTEKGETKGNYYCGRFSYTLLPFNDQGWMDRAPDDAEVSRAVRKLSNGKSGGDAECPIEYYKALEGSDVTKTYIRAILGDYWESGSMPEGDLADGPAARREVTLGMARRDNWRISYEQVNPKSGASHLRFEGYKESTSFEEAGKKGASSADFAWDFQRGFLRVHDPIFEPRAPVAPNFARVDVIFCPFESA
jgi:hypothetical protein